jgi:hypothetical protein
MFILDYFNANKRAQMVKEGTLRKTFLMVFLAICFSGNLATAASVTTNHNYINVANDAGVKFNGIASTVNNFSTINDYNYYGTLVNGVPTYSTAAADPSNLTNTYLIKADSGGTNELKISTTTTGGNVTLVNSTSNNPSGTIYVTNSGGRGFDNDIILFVSVKGPIADDFSLHITSNGYTWTPAPPTTSTPSAPTDATYIQGIDETFTKSDFIYGPQTTRPGSAVSGPLPLYIGQNTGDNTTAEYAMFIDLYVGNIKQSTLSGLTYLTNVDNGAAKVNFSFTGLDTAAAINAYGWCSGSNQGEGINWTNDTTGAASQSGYSIIYTGPPVVISATPADTGTNVPIGSVISTTFNTAMDTTTISNTTFTVQGPSGPVDGTFGYDTSSNTATFTPTGQLAYNTTYTVTVTGGVTDTSGNALTAKTWSFTTALDTNPPYVTSTTPASGATDAGTGGSVSATFSSPMDPNTINSSNFALTGPSGAVGGTVSYNSSTYTAVFTPTSLAAGTTYTATITTGVTNTSGTAMASQYSWQFTTTAAVDTTPPTVILTSPSNAATGVSINSPISATFSEAMNGSTINNSTFTVSNGSGYVSGSVNYDNSTHNVTFTPSQALSYQTSYTVTITTGVTDLAGNQMAASYSWTFVTGQAPDTTPPTVYSNSPADGATGVSINSPITVTFSEAMATGTMNGSTFTVNGVTGTVNYDQPSKTATFTPSSPLAYSTSYTANVSTDVTDLAGNHMAAPYSWTFTTGPVPDPAPPTISTTSPADGANVVPINSALTVTFNKPMNSSTITNTTFTLSDSSRAAVSGSVTYDSSKNTATFTPSAPLIYSSAYTATVTTGVQSSYNIPMATGKTWTFTTAPLYGDLEGSGAATNLNDILTDLRIAAGAIAPTPQQIAAGDVAPLVNGKPQPDGKIDVGDVLVLLLNYVGLLNW